MRNSNSITYKGGEYPSADIEMGGTIGCIRIATEVLQQALVKDGLYDVEVPYEVEALDKQIAYYVTNEEFKLPVKEVKKIIRIAYDEDDHRASSVKISIRKLKKGELCRLKDSDTALVWVRGEYVLSEKKFSTYQYDDVNHERLCKGETKVYVGFTFLKQLSAAHPITYLLPVYWASALFNDDYSGLNEEEERQIKDFLQTSEGRPASVDFDTEGFYGHNDAGTLPGNCAEFIFLIDE